MITFEMLFEKTMKRISTPGIDKKGVGVLSDPKIKIPKSKLGKAIAKAKRSRKLNESHEDAGMEWLIAEVSKALSKLVKDEVVAIKTEVIGKTLVEAEPKTDEYPGAKARYDIELSTPEISIGDDKVLTIDDIPGAVDDLEISMKNVLYVVDIDGEEQEFHSSAVFGIKTNLGDGGTSDDITVTLIPEFGDEDHLKHLISESLMENEPERD